ncbi:uncharacterized protein MBD-R2 [Chelonus insularis]|uniref:uncharacterized protein MBD-R2 n=1 Tax=Chelonus insularis TaxID=460826 RepID=UPI00158CE4F5|nr:uncharacterized protein LOC118064058 [Chelonus insularis]
MARKCCVRNCELDGHEVRAAGLPLHRLPKDPILRSKWLENGGFEPDFKPIPGQFICHRHFRRADYEKVKGTKHKFHLKKGSVPSIFDNYNDHPDPVIMPIKMSAVSYPQEDLDLIKSKITDADNDSNTTTEDIKCEFDSETFDSSVNSSTNDCIDSSEVVESVQNDNINHNNCDSNNGTENSLNNDTTLEESQDKGAENDDVNHSSPPVASSNLVNNKKNIENGNALVTAKSLDKKVTSPDGSGSTKVVNKSGLKFYPGARLEAKDFNEKWYAARIVETDWVEREVLIHFDKWSSRFDEWIPMDSSRLRVLQLSKSSEQTWTPPSHDSKMREFSVGERILATWADGRKYPAKVNAVLGNDRYDVLFDDGYGKIVRSSKMSKIAATTKKVTEKSMEKESYIGSKQERRDKKRKHTVMELFQHKRRAKADGEKMKKEENSNSDGTEHVNTENTDNHEANNSLSSEAYGGDDSGPEWVDGEPKGTESFVVDGNDGIRRSIIIQDKKLSPEWQKHFIQRKTGNSAGKWDVVFLHKITGRKFRTRNDLKVFFESQGQPDFDLESFDFCVHRRKKSKQKLKAETSGEAQKKIKTILPKNKMTSATENLLLIPTSVCPVPVTSTSTPAPEDNGTIYSVFIGGLRVEMEDSAYKCPKEGCNKTFRKENLLQMHIKHYHPEFSKYLGSTPNVADLAYARTIGEPVLDVTPRKSINSHAEKITKFDKKKMGQDKSLSSQLTNSAVNTADGSSPLSSGVNVDTHTADQISGLKEETKFDIGSVDSNVSLDGDDEIGRKSESLSAMSPGSLFDLKIKEEKTQTGIKTLLPLRSASSTDSQKTLDKLKSIDDALRSEKSKGQRKRQLSEYSSDTSVKSKRRHGVKEVDDYADLDDSTMDTEEPVTYVYRFSRRKSDENSQSGQLNDTFSGKSGTSKIKDASIDHEDGEGVMMVINGELVKVEQLRREEIINCTCGFMEEDGLMIQCDLCLCWQHGHCNAIEREKDVPEKYICYICRHPFRQRSSKKYTHDQDWIKEGKLQSLSKRTKNQAAINKRMAMLKRSYDLVGALLEIRQILHSLRVKINVAQKKDHPKLYLWAKHWEKSEIPEPQKEPVSVMEVVKLEPKQEESKTDVYVGSNSEMSIEKKEMTEGDSINSDTELMKILEEDNTIIDESKNVKKDTEETDTENDKTLEETSAKSVSEQENTIKSESTSETDKDVTEPESDGTLQTESNDVAEKNEDEQYIKEELKSPSQEPSVPLQPVIPEPEAPIDPAECRLRLLEHIEHFQNHIDSRLTTIEAQVSALEAMDPDDAASFYAVEPRTKETIQMLLRDLSTIRKLASLC